MNKRTSAVIALLLVIVIIFSYACGPDKNDKPKDPDPITGAPKLPSTPFNYAGAVTIPAHIQNYINNHPEVNNTPADNGITNDGATLGRVLFYDKSLSINNTVACASCHHQDKAFTDGLSLSKGFNNGLTRRNAMPLINLKYFKGKKMFWDLRAATLEDQVLMPITDHIEMGMPSLQELEGKLRNLSYYPDLFKKAFGSTEITSQKISKALAQFIRSISSFNSKYDQGLGMQFSNFTQQELKGKQLVAQLNCIECHSDLTNVRSPSNPNPSPTFLLVENTGENLFGAGSNNALDVNYTDNGIGEKTGLAKDMGTFKMPSLRNVELTAPYMHDGRFATLEQVIDHYNTGAKAHPNRGIQIPNGGYKFLSADDKAAIIAFLKTLTDQSVTMDAKFSDPFR
jgi:cytochrome c peroxidase